MDKRKQIFDAALKLFSQFGFHGTPTSKIAQEAGVANGTLFHYFKTKDDLIVALYLDGKHRLMEHLAANTTPADTLKGSLKSIYLNSLYWALDNKAEFSFMQQFQSSPYLAQIPAEEIEKYTAAPVQFLKQGIKDKIIKPLPADFIYSLVMAQTYGLNQYLAQNNFSKAKEHEFINQTFELLWDMIT